MMRRVGSKFSDTLRSCSGSWMKKCLAVISANLEPYNLIKFLAVSHNNKYEKGSQVSRQFFFFPCKNKELAAFEKFHTEKFSSDVT